MAVYYGPGMGGGGGMCTTMAVGIIFLIVLMFISFFLDKAGKNKEANNMRITELIVVAMLGMVAMMTMRGY